MDSCNIASEFVCKISAIIEESFADRAGSELTDEAEVTCLHASEIDSSKKLLRPNLASNM